MLPLVTCLQGKLAEVYFGFQKIDEIIHMYDETHDNSFDQFIPKLLT